MPAFPPKGATYIPLMVFLREVQQNALAVRQAATLLRPAQAEILQGYSNFLPSISANSSVTQNYGTTFDPFAFSRVQQTTTFASGSINANWLLFAGLANHYILRQARMNAAMVQASYHRVQTEVLAQALLQFSQTLTDSVLIELAQQRIARLRDQIQRLSVLIQAGQTLSLDSLTIAAQLAREEAQYLTLYNRHRENKLNLLQLMGWDSVSVDAVEFTLGIGAPDLGPLTESEAIQASLQTAPEVEEAKWRLLMQSYAVKSARAAYYPTLSLGASIQTNYSSNAGNIRFDPVQGIVREPSPFQRQVRDNVNQSIFLSLSIPIFQQLRRRTQVVRAEGSLRSAELQLEIQKQQVIRRTQQAYLAWQNALQQEAALSRSAEAARYALQQAQAQYEAGRISYWNYRESLLTANQAQLELEQARLDKAFRSLLLAAYIGKYKDL
ncbi:MAG: TolC family protein [Bacteroidia bacterium]|nr:TolC family protein [Bacteroidia bacterium]MCX7652889.1 TolC family protein [Bacteroidia bacterium]MDW8416643.1 TolC family protein [Bacteroidia bacterium]